MKKFVRQLYRSPEGTFGQKIKVEGWIRTSRASNTIGFIELNDGTFFKNLQIVFEADKIENYKDVARFPISTAIEAYGTLIETPDSKQPFELQAEEIIELAPSSNDYPLQKKRHTREFLREIPWFRPRTNLFSAVFRVRNSAAYAIHRFFQGKGFVYTHAPIITDSDGEGAGEMFRVTTLDLMNVPITDQNTPDYSKDFFAKSTYLNVTGQLQAEAMALAFRDVYTFAPTFRAENSNTSRHAAEFWMMEPEMAFADLNDNMNNIEEMIKFVMKAVLEECPEEMEFFNQFVDKGLLETLENVVSNEFERITYTEAVELLEKSGHKFDYDVHWGMDLQTEHERYITEKIFKKPVFVYNYPKEIKAFYMRHNEDGKTVAAVDLLVPGIGEIVGGSQREERYEPLVARMKELDMDLEPYQWYLELRRYGGVYHSGYGLGFERLIMYLTGVSNIRDVIVSPRTVGHCNF
ncbi:MAG: asparagine--tRNA ligase [Firmicutes bacterium]|jgi:asparaginyl-tRNA synthetase|nr:asparagine--tRNA ligase [Bacillota bacterium]